MEITKIPIKIFIIILKLVIRILLIINIKTSTKSQHPALTLKPVCVGKPCTREKRVQPLVLKLNQKKKKKFYCIKHTSIDRENIIVVKHFHCLALQVSYLYIYIKLIIII